MTLHWQAAWAEAFEYVSTWQYFWLKKKLVAVFNVSFHKEHAWGEKRIMVLTNKIPLEVLKVGIWTTGGNKHVNMKRKPHHADFKNKLIWKLL